jgi:hypothetical protein
MKVLGVVVLSLLALTANAAIEAGRPLPVRILYDNSGSMYPGYRPPGTPDRRSREELGVHFFHQSAQFAPWLEDFVRRQAPLDAGSIGMWTFTSNGPFTASDIQEVHPAVPAGDFRPSIAIAHFPAYTGNNTYLTETLQEFARDYTGLLWLVTDNIVETTAGAPDAGVQRFFETLARGDSYRSVHLYKHSFEENGQTAALAIYGILVSAEPVPDETLARYDALFRELFPGQEHLKLKNLSIEPVTLHADLQLVLDDRDKGMFEEGGNVRLDLQGEIRSRLTQHAVTAGHYELAIASAFVPETWAQKNLGAQSLAPDVFDSAGGDIREDIPPNGARRIQARLESAQPVAFTPSNIAEWVTLAWNGATVRYTGTVRMTLTDVNVRLQRQQMAGIFGIDHASSIFAFQDVTSLHGINPSVVPVTFALRTGSSRTAILLAILTLLAAVAGAVAFLLSRTRTFRIKYANAPETITALRRLGTHNVIYDGRLLGRLSRGLLSGYAFAPARANPEFTVVSANDGETWDVKFIGETSRRLTIKAEGGGKAAQRKPRGSVSGPAPPPSPASPTFSPPRRPPKLGR